MLKVFAMFKIRLWYDSENHEGNLVDNIGIRCSNSVKTTGLSVKNTNYKYMFTKFVLNTVLHRVRLSYIIEPNKQLKYDIDKHDLDWLTNGP